MEMTKGGRNSKLHLAPDAQGMPVRAFLTAAPVADCRVAPALIEGLSADVLLACCGDDSDALIAMAEAQGMEPVIPARRNRKNPRESGNALYIDGLQQISYHTPLQLKYYKELGFSALTDISDETIKKWIEYIGDSKK